MSGAHPEATKGAGGAVACVRAVGPSEGRTTVRGASPHTCSTVLAVVHPNQRNSLHSSRKSEHTCEGTRAERAWEGHGERVVAVPQHATRRCGGRAGMVWVWVGR